MQRPISWNSDHKRKKKNEIFVDILERVSGLFNANGSIANSGIDGGIQMKSYLSGNPDLRMALNEDLVIGSHATSYGATALDDCNFHECVRLNEFENDRVLNFNPPDGEFTVMNYRVTGDFRAPFRIFPFIEDVTASKIEMTVKVRADLPETNYSGNVVIRIPVPKGTASCSGELPPNTTGQSTEYRSAEKVLVWSVKKMTGGSEHQLRVRITLVNGAPASSKKEVGPVSMTFEIPMHSVSALTVRYLRIAEASKSYTPFRWVRYITQSDSYVARVSS